MRILLSEEEVAVVEVTRRLHTVQRSRPNTYCLQKRWYCRCRTGGGGGEGAAGEGAGGGGGGGASSSRRR